ncbi:MAG: GAF domain-containing protein [Chloroflexota bacterium]
MVEKSSSLEQAAQGWIQRRDQFLDFARWFQRAALLAAFLIALVALASGNPQFRIMVLPPLLFFLVAVVAQRLARAGRLSLGVYFLTGALYLAVPGFVLVMAAALPILFLVAVMPLLLVGLFVSPRQVWRAAVVTAVTSLLAAALDSRPILARLDISAVAVLVAPVVALVVGYLIHQFGRSLGLALEEAQNYAQDLKESQAALQMAVDALGQRNVQLQTAAQVAEAAGSILDPEALEQQVVELIRQGFDFYYVGLFLVDEAGEWAVLRAGTGEAGQVMLERGHRLAIGGESMIGACLAEGRARIALDVGEEAVRFDNPLLPQTRSEMALPLRARGEVIGGLTIQSQREAAFSDQDISILQTMAAQVANALQNARLYQSAQSAQRDQRRRSEELAALHQLSLELAQEQRDLDTVLVTITQRIMGLLDADGGGIWLWREAEQELELVFTFQVGAVDFTGRRLKPGEGLTGQAFAQAELQVVDDYLAWVGHAVSFEDAPFWAALAAPMIWQNRVVGVLVATRSQVGYAFSEGEKNLAQLLAVQAAIFMQNARLFEQTLRRSVQLQAAAEVSRAASSILAVDELLAVSVELIRERFDLYYVGLFLLEEIEGFAVLRAGSGEAGRQMLLRGHRLAVGGQSMVGECVARAEARIRQGSQTDVARFDNPLLPHTRSELALPLVARGRVIGAMSIQSVQELAFSEADVSVLQTLADQLANAIENARLFGEIERRSRELAALNAVSGALNRSLSTTEIMTAALEQVLQVAGMDAGLVSLYDPTTDRLLLSAQKDLPQPLHQRLTEQGLNGTLCELVFRDAVDLGIGDMQDGAPVDVSGLLALGLRSYLGTPLAIQEEVFGTLCIFGRLPRQVIPADFELMRAIGAQMGLAINNAQLFEEAQARLQEITRLHRQYLQEHWQEFLSQEETGGQIGYLYDQQGVQPGRDLWRPEIEMAVARGRTLALSAEDGVWDENGDEAGSALVVPLQLRGQIIGVMDFLDAQQDRPWTEDDIALVESVAEQVALAVENARAYREVQKTAVQLQEMDRLKSQFLANMSHELRTPLNSIIGFSRVMLKGIDGPLTDLQRTDLSSIYNNGQHLLGLINDILDLSRIEAGKMELIFEPIELPPVIDGVLSTAIGLVKGRPVELVKELADDLPIVRADSTRIRQVILNLVSNAAKFTEQGRITVRAWREAEDVAISISDTGIGIPADQQEKIFREFEQVDGSATRRVGGTGLGLPISRHFVELHGGRIWVESAEGQGSTFTFTLPIYGPDRVQDPELAALQIDPDRRLVLAIEDNAQMVDFYRRYLQAHGYQVVGLADAERAQQWVRELGPFAVLLDVLLPAGDGWDVLAKLKTSRETAQVPVIVCSIVDEEARALSLGAAAYLHKPVLKEDLLHALAVAVRLQGQ